MDQELRYKRFLVIWSVLLVWNVVCLIGAVISGTILLIALDTFLVGLAIVMIVFNYEGLKGLR